MSKSLQEIIIEKLLPGELPVKDVVREISFTEKITEQGVYKAITIMKQKEIVSVYRRMIVLSPVWLHKQIEIYRFAVKAGESRPLLDSLKGENKTMVDYQRESNSAKTQNNTKIEIEKYILNNSKKKIKFEFKTLSELDLFWTYSYIHLAKNINIAEPSYSVQPHDFYLYAREETDRYWMSSHVGTQRLSRNVITHAGALDYAVIKERKKILGKRLEYVMAANPFKQASNTYYNIIGDYIFEATFDKGEAESLNTFCKTYSKLPLDIQGENDIAQMLHNKGVFTLTIEKNKNKTAKMKQKLKKYFE